MMEPGAGGWGWGVNDSWGQSFSLGRRQVLGMMDGCTIVNVLHAPYSVFPHGLKGQFYMINVLIWL